jgi:endonuclease-8
MPEGDTIHKLAHRLRVLLQGKPLRRVESHGGQQHPALCGLRVARVEAVGKHLVFTVEGGSTIRCHLGMKGRWHRYAPEEAFVGAPALLLVTDDDALICFRTRDVELLPPRHPRAGARTAGLGPDLLADEADLSTIAARARQQPGRAIGELLLDQRVAAGIGNVYKSEVLFLVGVNPWRPVAELDDDALGALFAEARRLMQRNLGPGMRTTTSSRGDGPKKRSPASGLPGSRYWVYRRAGRPCHRCATPIVSALQGDQARRTYYCPTCQRGVERFCHLPTERL